MIRRSLRWRLVLFGAVAVTIALVVSAVGLALLFERHVQRVAVADLESRSFAIAALIEPDAAGGPTLRQSVSDPLYDQPFSGHYWQVDLDGQSWRSRSLWDYSLPSEPVQAAPGAFVLQTLPGPRGEDLLAVRQSLTVGTGASERPLTIIVATHRDEVIKARQGFLSDMLPYMAVLAVLILSASWVQITLGLQPLAEVSRRVAALRSGGQPRIGDDLPQEVLPLADEIDQLLDARDGELGRARHRASDLAHGFKTPLQALMGDAEKLRQNGETEIAEGIETVAMSMQRLVDRELARVRIQSHHHLAEAEPAKVIHRVVGVLRRTPKGATVQWLVDAPEGIGARIDVEDLTEAVGALAENALRHCVAAVSLSARVSGEWVELAVRDDGPGVAESDLSRLAGRGVRLDSGGDGQGIGLSIVSEIAEAANGALLLRNSRQGFEAVLRLRAHGGFRA